MQYAPTDGFLYYYNLVDHDSWISYYSAHISYDYFAALTEEQAAFRYNADKWSIKQIIGHITDHERIKMFRAFQLSRKLKVELWGYDQEHLVNNARFDDIPYPTLINDFKNVRASSLSFIKTLSNAQLKIIGNAKNHHISLQQFLISIIGHELHHVNIIKEKYL